MNICYIDTRGVTKKPLEFSEALIKGLADGGGLFVPQVIPQASLSSILDLANLPYAQQAARIYSWFGVDFADSELEKLMSKIYGSNFDTPEICPISQVGNNYVLELWHGPTSAFKDMALQCLPVFFSETVEKRLSAAQDLATAQDLAAPQDSLAEGCSSEKSSQPDYLIAVATSGDTGKAALCGFAEREHISIVVYYPDGGVSDIQYKQMATQAGKNVSVFGVRGNFDDCQTNVKRMFNDAGFNAQLLREKNIALSSANSINWGRLLPQVVYYLSAYARMAKNGQVEPGSPIDVTVPTGNFGNILACWYAKQVGAPIGRIVCASNENRVLTDFIQSGTYTTKGRKFVLTPSPSMDILVSSNLERQLFELTGRDPEKISAWMKSLREDGKFSIDEATFARLQAEYACGSVSNEECLQTIAHVEREHGYLLDPHTAVAWTVAEHYKQQVEACGVQGDKHPNTQQDGEHPSAKESAGESAGSSSSSCSCGSNSTSDSNNSSCGKPNPMLVVSTAHWAKFGGDVYRALTGIPAGEPLPDDVAGLTGAELNRKVLELRGSANTSSPANNSNSSGGDKRIPPALDCLDEQPIRFTKVIDGKLEAVEDAVIGFLEQ